MGSRHAHSPKPPPVPAATPYQLPHRTVVDAVHVATAAPPCSPMCAHTSANHRRYFLGYQSLVAASGHQSEHCHSAWGSSVFVGGDRGAVKTCAELLRALSLLSLFHGIACSLLAACVLVLATLIGRAGTPSAPPGSSGQERCCTPRWWWSGYRHLRAHSGKRGGWGATFAVLLIAPLFLCNAMVLPFMPSASSSRLLVITIYVLAYTPAMAACASFGLGALISGRRGGSGLLGAICDAVNEGEASTAKLLQGAGRCSEGLVRRPTQDASHASRRSAYGAPSMCSEHSFRWAADSAHRSARDRKSVGPARKHSKGKFVGQARDLIFGAPRIAATGLFVFMQARARVHACVPATLHVACSGAVYLSAHPNFTACLPLSESHWLQADEREVRQRLGHGLVALREEWVACGTDEDLENLAYILDEEAGSSDECFQHGWMRDRAPDGAALPERMTADGSGYRLADFLKLKQARDAHLTESQVAALRMYTTSSFKSINEPLRQLARDSNGVTLEPPRLAQPYPLPITLTLVYEALKQLRAAYQEKGKLRLQRPTPSARWANAHADLRLATRRLSVKRPLAADRARVEAASGTPGTPCTMGESTESMDAWVGKSSSLLSVGATAEGLASVTGLELTAPPPVSEPCKAVRSDGTHGNGDVSAVGIETAIAGRTWCPFVSHATAWPSHLEPFISYAEGGWAADPPKTVRAGESRPAAVTALQQPLGTSGCVSHKVPSQPDAATRPILEQSSPLTMPQRSIELNVETVNENVGQAESPPVQTERRHGTARFKRQLDDLSSDEQDSNAMIEAGARWGRNISRQVTTLRLAIRGVGEQPVFRTTEHIKILYRGVRNLKASRQFIHEGGTEMAALSTTDDFLIAVRYARIAAGSARGASALIFRVLVPSFMQLGAQLRFLSAFPQENEYLYPPLTYLRSRGVAAHLKHEGHSYTIVDVEPVFPS